MKSRSFLFAGAIFLVLVAAFFLLPKGGCCEKDNPSLDATMVSAGKGDIDAIRKLYEIAKVEKVRPMEEHWALQGAMKGDRNLRLAYSELFAQMDQERQRRVLAQIKEQPTLAGAACVLKSLGASMPQGWSCQE